MLPVIDESSLTILEFWRAQEVYIEEIATGILLIYLAAELEIGMIHEQGSIDIL